MKYINEDVKYVKIPNFFEKCTFTSGTVTDSWTLHLNKYNILVETLKSSAILNMKYECPEEWISTS